jgi:hypothetical protein
MLCGNWQNSSQTSMNVKWASELPILNNFIQQEVSLAKQFKDQQRCFSIPPVGFN